MKTKDQITQTMILISGLIISMLATVLKQYPIVMVIGLGIQIFATFKLFTITKNKYLIWSLASLMLSFAIVFLSGTFVPMMTTDMFAMIAILSNFLLITYVLIRMADVLLMVYASENAHNDFYKRFYQFLAISFTVMILVGSIGTFLEGFTIILVLVSVLEFVFRIGFILALILEVYHSKKEA
ncbi:hypothetical protein [Erysipelothrix anatis]|uniref:hypothetical protein n=1 Tax=Erysipelothrix anatis TaxID=2683713 RepID=UPI001408EA4D|nr:hypothetical protein [Erysipelothrix anatis]